MVALLDIVATLGGEALVLGLGDEDGLLSAIRGACCPDH